MIYESLRKRLGSEDLITSLRGLLSSWNSNLSKDERGPPQTDSPSSGKPIDIREIFRGNSFPEPNHNDNDLQFNSPGIEESDVNSGQFSYNENNFVDTPSPSSRHEEDTTYIPTDESQEPTVLPDPSTSDPRDSTIEPEDTDVDLRKIGTFPDPDIEEEAPPPQRDTSVPSIEWLPGSLRGTKSEMTALNVSRTES
jgi:hypothetical protein